MLQATGVFAGAAVGGPAASLQRGRVPGCGANGPQEGCRMKGACAHLQTQRLQNDATLAGPKGLQSQNQALKSAHIGPVAIGRGMTLRHRLAASMYRWNK